MPHQQESLGAFASTDSSTSDQSQTEAETTPPSPATTTPSSSNLAVWTDAWTLPDDYPARLLERVGEVTLTLPVCLPNGQTETATVVSVAGDGHMGIPGSHRPDIEIPSLLRACRGLPVHLSGGGMSSPMGSQFSLGRLVDVERTGDNVRVTLDGQFHYRGRARDGTQARRLGAYELSVPQTRADAETLAQALFAYTTDSLEYLDPERRNTAATLKRQRAVVEQATPGDRVSTPAYASQLRVLSEPCETAAIVSKQSLPDKTIPVIAVTVSNPRGGFYQLGVARSDASPTQTQSRSYYCSHSQQSPPTPNTAFTRDTRFGAKDVTWEDGDLPTDTPVVEPDAEVRNSPLPEPRLRTSLTEVDGIGDGTLRKLSRLTDTHLSAESVAHTLYGSGTEHDRVAGELRTIINKLPQSAQIHDTLKGYCP